METREITRFSELISQKLVELREEILEAADGTKTVELDQQSIGRLSRMDAIQQQAMAIALEKRREAEIFKLTQALARIDEGEYGYCEDCGDDIPTKRLEINLSSTRCVSCMTA
ncbi:MAG: TraR/DksA family transcriptional regulator [Paracoccaceae bacterium]|nr:TraR/DksA family transcriptional regulator [Paracoccaceae bacterium]